MRRSTILASLFTGVLGLATIGCGTTKPPPAPQPPAAEPAPQKPVAGAVPAPVTAPAVLPVAPAGKESPKAAPGNSGNEPAKSSVPTVAVPMAKEPVAAPAKPPVTATPVPATAAAAPAAAESPVASAHPKVGPEKCMMCHRIQYTSWSESKHKAKGLDCEGCHGNGGDYKAIPVMKDRAAAVKAGLILPGLVFCKKCHVKADASFLPTAHAHKAK